MKLRRLKIAPSADKEILINAVMRLPEKEAEKLLLSVVREAMRERLEFSNVYRGRSGWHTAACANAELKKALLKNAEKGDWVDVMNLAAMLYVREQIFEEEYYQEVKL